MFIFLLSLAADAQNCTLTGFSLIFGLPAAFVSEGQEDRLAHAHTAWLW